MVHKEEGLPKLELNINGCDKWNLGCIFFFGCSGLGWYRFFFGFEKRGCLLLSLFEIGIHLFLCKFCLGFCRKE